MKVNPNQGPVPANDKEPNHKDGGGDTIFGFADILRKIVLSKPMLLPLLRSYGFTNKRPLFRHHSHKLDKKGEPISINDFVFGSKSVWVYVVFLIEFLIRLFLIAIYLIAIMAILLVILRGLQLPEYFRTEILRQPAPPISVKVVQ